MSIFISEQRDVGLHLFSSITENRLHRRRAGDHRLSFAGTNFGVDDLTAHDVAAEIDTAERLVESTSYSQPFESSSPSFKSGSHRCQIEPSSE